MTMDATGAARDAATEPAREAYLRSRTYALLAGLLARPPDSAVLESLAGAPLAGRDGGSMYATWQDLLTAASRADPNAVDDEFHDLFIGLGRGELLPFASWYRTGALMGQPLAELRRDISGLGFERQPGVSEPEDHVGVVLEIMSALSEPRPDNGVELQRWFFAAHLQPWVPRFFGDLETARAADFYHSVARLGLAFLDIERGYLGVDDKRAKR